MNFINLLKRNKIEKQKQIRMIIACLEDSLEE